MIKVPAGTKSKLRRINRNVSALLREQIDRLLQQKVSGSAYEKAAHLCGVIQGGSKTVSVSKDYLRKYAPKDDH